MNDFLDAPCEQCGHPRALRCRPGDLALIVGYADQPCGRGRLAMDRWKLGRIVRVQAPAPSSRPCARLWWIEPIYSPTGSRMRRESDHNLWPLVGLPDESEADHAREGRVIRLHPSEAAT